MEDSESAGAGASVGESVFTGASVATEAGTTSDAGPAKETDATTGAGSVTETGVAAGVGTLMRAGVSSGAACPSMEGKPADVWTAALEKEVMDNTGTAVSCGREVMLDVKSMKVSRRTAASSLPSARVLEAM